MPLHLSWSDVGSWEGIYKAYKKDENGNVIIGNADLMDTKNSLIISKSRPIKIYGLDGIIAIESSEGVFVSGRSLPHEDILGKKILYSNFE